MGKKVYGIDLEGDITPEMVRDAIVECFYKAHCMDSEMNSGEVADKSYCSSLVKKAFSESDGDFENPNKESIMAAMGYLKEFSQNFRDPKIVEKHAADVMQLVEKLKG